MELNDNVLDQLKKDIERIDAHIDARHLRVAHLQGRLEAIDKLVLPFHPELAMVEIATIKKELEEWQQDQHHTDIELDAMATLLIDHVNMIKRHEVDSKEKESENGPDTDKAN